MKNLFFFSLLMFVAPFLISAQEVQWASKVIEYSTQYASKENAANQVLGKPNCMPQGGDISVSWCPANKSNKEFIKVGFEKPMKIQQIIIAENFNPTAVTKVLLYDAKGKEYKAFKGKPKMLSEKARMFSIIIPMTEYEVTAIKVFMDLEANGKYSEIDAIGISSTTDPFVSKPNVANLTFVSSKENLGDKVNSTYDELLPVISPDGKTLFLCRDDDPKNVGGQDIWMSEIGPDGQWTKAVNVGGPLNNKKHNFVCSVTPDGNKVLLGGLYSGEGKGISFGTKNRRGLWDMPTKIPIKDYYNKNSYNEFNLGNSGRVILMTVERDDTYGAKDIYVSFLQEDGEWSVPMNLGPTVNTAAKETSPFLASDERTIYYSSGGFPGYGNNDIFMTRRLDDTWTKWSEPVNLGPQINTPDWDAYYTVTASGDYAYFVSNDKSIGAGDIFRIKLPQEVKPDPVVLVSGKVLNAKTKEPISAKITYQILPDGKEAGVANSNPNDGSYKITLPSGKRYAFLASAPGYISVNENLDLSDLKEYKEINKDLYLVPIEIGQTVRLNNIFFESGKSDLLPESFIELDRLVKVMNDNGTMEIEIEGHTDNVGSDVSNLSLSKNRAKAVLDYLISKGINGNRLKSNGYGETKPLSTNDTDEGRALNRRVQFTIIAK